MLKLLRGGCVGGLLLLVGCAGPTRPVEVPDTHPASPAAAETPVPTSSATLRIDHPTETGGR